ncbi:MAG: 3-deoxy-8-phosphooctulonate synthase [Myxococcota bacterium]
MLTFESGQTPLVVAGPCVLEDRDFTLTLAETLRKRVEARGFRFVFKSSFDKANRTRWGSPRGPGLQDGLRLLEDVRSVVGVPVLTDVHETQQCNAVCEVVDVVQVPAFLSRQTDLLLAVSEAASLRDRNVNIKKGPFMAPDDVEHVVDKVKAGGHRQPWITERGTSFGHHDLVVDYRGFAVMQRHAPLIFDGTHSAQRPAAAGSQSGGDRRWVPALVRAAVAVGVQGLFLEVHPEPDRAPSDSATSLDVPLFESVLDDARRIWNQASSDGRWMR